MEINHRIELLKKHFGLSNAEFSEKINVQPSSLSHIFSGRNRPSIDFILKIKKAFPEISLNWILLGEGNMDENKESVYPFSVDDSPTPTSSNKVSYTIEKIIFFYRNGTFKIYNP
ncbi:MAG: helix-turn-helix transcriptional regulator [Flavobacteriales bacterium]